MSSSAARLQSSSRAHFALLARDAARDIAQLPGDALEDLWEALVDLPATDLTLLVTPPKLIGPDLQHLLDGAAADDPDWDTEALIRVAADIDSFQQRARLADALVRLRDQARISRSQAAVAILDLDSSSTRFVDSSLIEAIALAAGAVTTPGGLQLAAKDAAETATLLARSASVRSAPAHRDAGFRRSCLRRTIAWSSTARWPRNTIGC